MIEWETLHIGGEADGYFNTVCSSWRGCFIHRDSEVSVAKLLLNIRLESLFKLPFVHPDFEIIDFERTVSRHRMETIKGDGIAVVVTQVIPHELEVEIRSPSRSDVLNPLNLISAVLHWLTVLNLNS